MKIIITKLIILFCFILERIIALYGTRKEWGRKFIVEHKILHPNSLTLIRMPMGIVSVLFACKGYWILATLWFFIFMLTDLSDGTIARQCNLETEMGKWLDPLSDKILTFPVLLLFALSNKTNLSLPITIVSLYIIVDTIGQISRFWLKGKAANWYGKIKTTFVIIIISLLFMKQIDILLPINQNTINIMMVFALILAVCSLFSKLPCAFMQKKKDYFGVFFNAILFLLSILIISGTYYLIKSMGSVNFEQILIHLQASPLSLKRYVTIEHILIFIICVVLFFAYLLLEIVLLKFIKNNIIRISIFLCPIILFFLSSIYFSSSFKVLDFITNRHKISTMVDDNYFYPDPSFFIAPEKKQNLIVIFCESMERTFIDQTVFNKILIPNLYELQHNHLHIEKCVQVNGTNCTISSLSAVIYGMPRLLFSMERERAYFEADVYAKSPSIFHVLEKSGYKFTHIQGSDENFVGKKDLFLKYKNFDLISFKDLKNDLEYKELCKKKSDFVWGVNDRIMLKYAKKKILELAKSESPFCATILTLDTHVEGYLEGVNSKNSNYEEILQVQDKLLGDFINWIQEQSFAKDTTIIMTGDHCSMRPDIGEVKMQNLSDGTWIKLKDNEIIPQRTIYNCIINPVCKPPKNINNRLFATFDITPTILHSIGFRWNSNHFGLGTSLFSEDKTLLEKFGIQQYEIESRRYSVKYINILNGKFDK